MKAILTDVMGTTSPVGFVKTLMKDFSDNALSYVNKGEKEAIELIERIKEEAKLGTYEETVDYINEQIDQRNLQPHFLSLVGMVNVDGYKKGRLQGEFFDDVIGAFKNWKDNGKGIYVYSNGSEESLIKMFRTAKQGDIGVFVNGSFDTDRIGSKSEPDSYKKIGGKILVDPADMLFLSDVLTELDAANDAGCPVHLVVRPGNKPVEANSYKVINNFSEIKL